ncbi:MAG: hypothetical protein Greene041679_97, partial [Parcubacteria group bacterium Greene0416_79]
MAYIEHTGRKRFFVSLISAAVAVALYVALFAYVK